MSKSEIIIRFLVATGAARIHRDDLRKLTAGSYEWAGANGGLFGGTHPWMESDGDFRQITVGGMRRVSSLP